MENMVARNLKDVHRLYQEAVNAGSVDAILDLYEDNATFVTGPGSPVRGKAAIREAVLGFLAMKPRIALETVSIIEGDPNLALLSCRWELHGTQDGKAVRMTGTSREVLRRHANGNWLYVIDDPGIGR
jgi:uncharacterized protein (TIGR02246 family)